ncbi:MAG TPA: hypothetical protein PLE77_14875 [Kiritimatiellia bacterium]|nr:hypothetical protein [Kiritimatiellia bacterium]
MTLASYDMNVLIPSILIACVPIALGIDIAVRTRRRRGFMARSVPLSDEEFLRCIDAPKEFQRLILALRKRTARLCKVPSDMIRPEHRPQDLFPLMPGWDSMMFILAMESELNITIPQPDDPMFPTFPGEGFLCFVRQPADSFGQWCIDTAQWAEQRVQADGAPGFGESVQGKRPFKP